jgi:hypothetical protein
LGTLVHALQLGVATEGKSPNAIAVVTKSARYFHDFIVTTGYSSEAARASQNDIRGYQHGATDGEIAHLEGQLLLMTRRYKKRERN